MDNTFDLPVDSDNHSTDAEAALEALRAAIGGNPTEEYTSAHDATLASSSDIDSTLQSVAAASAVTLAQKQALEKSLVALTQLSNTNQTILDQMNLPSLLQGLMGSLDLLVKSNKRQVEIVKNLHSQLTGSNTGAMVDPILIGYVQKSEYDALKARYDALANQDEPTHKGRSRTARASTSLMELDEDRSRVGSAALEAGGRKRRSIKLEHLVHKLANRRLGVEYIISGFETPGTKDLPDPHSIAPTEAESVNKIDEYRPNFKGDVSASTVKPYIDQVIEDVVEAWADMGEDEPHVDRKKITESVHVYWTRLCKRYDEQCARDRGEIHKDEVTRRKQNQYRRQQSLLARRLAAFNTSPLNCCKLRSLYRTLLTIDFACPTNERPDPSRQYTPEEWTAYQKLANGGRHPEAHEVVDQHWWSPNIRALLQILDTYSNDQNNRMKRKGRPKQPAPLFHMPPELWDRQNLPNIKPKDHAGLPLAGASGLVLFRFHVDQKIQDDNPIWAAGLYDNPPVPEEDLNLANLSEVMEASIFAHLRPQVKAMRQAATVTHLSIEEVAEVLSRPTPSPDEPIEPDSQDLTTEFMARSLDSMFNLTNHPFAIPGSNTIIPYPEAAQVKPGAGSSAKARRLTKRDVNEAPTGSATPVAKRFKGNNTMVDFTGDVVVDNQVEGVIEGDKNFLEGL